MFAVQPRNGIPAIEAGDTLCVRGDVGQWVLEWVRTVGTACSGHPLSTRGQQSASCTPLHQVLGESSLKQAAVMLPRGPPTQPLSWLERP